MLIAHLSNTHLAPGAPATAAFAPVVAYLRRLPMQPDAVLVTGDLPDHGTAVEYTSIARLRGLGAPLLVLPGNHDDRGVQANPPIDRRLGPHPSALTS